MNRHGHTKRIGPGDMWKCQAAECGDVGPFHELMARECKHHTTPTDVINTTLQEELDKQ